MHRGRAYGLRWNDQGDTLWPKEVEELLYELCFFRGDVRDLVVAASLDMNLRHEEMTANARWRRAYLGRYLRFPPESVDAMMRFESNAYLKLVGELVAKEAGKLPTVFENL